MTNAGLFAAAAIATVLVVGVVLAQMRKKRVEPSTDTLETARDVVGFYQRLGFFSGQDPADVLAAFEDEMGEPLVPTNPWDDVYLLGLDKEAVWFDDPEADVCRENKVYTRVLQEWARISRGAFNPSDIEEVWEGEQGPIKLRFTMNGTAHELSPAYQQDWLDLGVIEQLNALLKDADLSFAWALDGNTAIVLALDARQQAELTTQRNFPFAVAS